MEAGVLLAVLVDSEDESILIIRTQVAPVVYRRGDRLDLGAAVPDLRIDVAALFDALRF